MKAAFFAFLFGACIVLFPAVAEETTVVEIPAGEIFSGIKINASGTNAGITVIPAKPGETAVLQMLNVKGGMRFSDGTMIVEVQPAQTTGRYHFNSFGFVIGRQEEITLRLPLDSLDSVDLETRNGWIRIEDMDFTEGTLFTRNGGFRLKNANFSRGSLTARNGTIRLIDTGWDTLDASTRNGIVNISGARAGEGSTSVRTRNGPVHLGILGNEDDFSYTITTSNGPIYVNGGHTTVRRSGDRNNILEGGTGAHQISIQTGNGRANLEFEKGV